MPGPKHPKMPAERLWVSHTAASGEPSGPHGRVRQMRGMQLLGAVFDLNGRAPYVHWHFFEMSAANLAVIGAMLLVFALAILLPFPGSRRRRGAGGAGPGAGAHEGSDPGRPPAGGAGAPGGQA